MVTSRLMVGFLACGVLGSAQSSETNAVIDWNAITIQAIATAGTARPGPSGFLDAAMVQAAVYDAVEAIDRRFRLYHFSFPNACGSVEVAAAKAALDVLVDRFSDRSASLEGTYHAYLSSHGLSESDPGVAVGQLAAAVVIALRAHDGSFASSQPPFTGGTEPGVWRPTISYLAGPPPSFEPMEIPWLGDVMPFTLAHASQFRAGPPPPLTSGRYARDYNEVKTMGSFSGSLRSAAQTDLAYFWATNYLAVWN
jgi:hypothetical protein